MANSIIIVPVAIGDTIYRKKVKVASCRYFGDRYAGTDGQPNCHHHEYDCERGCDAKFSYYAEPIKVDSDVVLEFASEQLRPGSTSIGEKYLITKEDADDWLCQMEENENKKESKS